MGPRQRLCVGRAGRTSPEGGSAGRACSCPSCRAALHHTVHPLGMLDSQLGPSHAARWYQAGNSGTRSGGKDSCYVLSTSPK